MKRRILITQYAPYFMRLNKEVSKPLQLQTIGARIADYVVPIANIGGSHTGRFALGAG